MIRRTSFTALMSAVALVAGLGASAGAYAQQTTLRVFSGGANQPLANEICQYLGIPPGRASIKRFSSEGTTTR